MAEKTSNWSRGGAMFNLIYLALAKKFAWAVVATLALLIPFLNFVMMIVLFIVGGLKGKAWIDSDDSMTPATKKTFTTFFDRVGRYIFLLVLVVLILSLLMVILGVGTWLRRFNNWGLDMLQNLQGLEGLEALQGLEGAEWIDDLAEVIKQLEALETAN